MNEQMRIAIAQLDCRVADVEANCRTITSMVEDAAAAKCDVVVLPEMADTGYDIQAIPDCASNWEDGPHRMLSELAARLRITVICGLSEREGDRIYNAMAIIDRSGATVAKYRKAHLFSAAPVHEDRYFTRGDSLASVSVCGFKIGLMICYDLRFPEMARALALGGAHILVTVAAFPFPRLEHWKTLTACRAIENQVYVAAANRVGTDGNLTFCGTSRLIDPYGTTIAGASEFEPSLVIGEISRERIQKTRSLMAVFEDRREELYRSPIRDGKQ